MRVVTFKIEEELLEKLDYYAIKHRLNRSEAIREAIKLLLSSQPPEDLPPLKVEKIEL